MGSRGSGYCQRIVSVFDYYFTSCVNCISITCINKLTFSYVYIYFGMLVGGVLDVGVGNNNCVVV